MPIFQYFKKRYAADRAGTFGILAYILTLAASVAYLWKHLPMPATVLFSIATAETADPCARWFTRD